MTHMFAATTVHPGPDHLPTRQRDAAWPFVFAAWFAAAVSTAGALFLGEVMRVAPCSLCWYQRAFMFPLVLVLGVGLFPLDRQVLRYGVPLVVVGWLIAVYHVLLTVGIVPETMTPCTQGVPCSRIDVQWFGFLTIPLLSLIAFSLIGLALAGAHSKLKP